MKHTRKEFKLFPFLDFKELEVAEKSDFYSAFLYATVNSPIFIKEKLTNKTMENLKFHSPNQETQRIWGGM